MKGLRRYIAKHGRHFTTELVMKVIDCKWHPHEITRSTEGRVYYNVSSSTLGDLVFLVNIFSDSFSKRRCMDYALDIVGDVSKEGYAFNAWLMSNEDIDLTEYV